MDYRVDSVIVDHNILCVTSSVNIYHRNLKVDNADLHIMFDNNTNTTFPVISQLT